MKSSRGSSFMRRFLPPSDASTAGAKARRSGNSLEGAITAANEWYEHRGEALIEKVNPPVHGWGESMHMGASTVDFTGTRVRRGAGFTRSGIAFDVKAITGKARFGLEHIPQSKKNAARERTRFLRQVAYLQNARDRHGYDAFFLLYCSELDTLWLCDDLATLQAGASVLVREKVRGTKVVAGGAIHHLPHLTNPGNGISLLGLAATTRMDTGRPYLDYLSLLTR